LRVIACYFSGAPMHEIDQALSELDRLQEIVTRHEGHMFALRGWLLAVVGGLLAAYYTDNVQMSVVELRVALLAVPVLFLLLELRHVNLIEAVVERAGDVESMIAAARGPSGLPAVGWYRGPKINETCRGGAHRWWPRSGMTFVLNLPFYVVVLSIIIVTAVSLPTRV
jgi:hypothetical protein